MDFFEYLEALRRGWLAVVLCALAGLALALTYLLAVAPSYRATAAVYISTTSTTNVSELSQATVVSNLIVKDYAALATSPFVLGRVVRQIGLKEAPKDLAARITTAVPLDTSILEITVSDTSARRAALIADSVSSSLATSATELAPNIGNAASVVRVTKITSASVPSQPTSPSALLVIVGGAVVGVVVGGAIAVIRRASR